MNMTYGQMVSFFESLGEFSKIKLPPTAAVKVVRNARKIDVHMQDFSKARQNLINSHAVLDSNEKPKEKDGKIIFADEKEFIKDINELIETECEIDIDKFTEKEVESMPDMEVSLIASVFYMFPDE